MYVHIGNDEILNRDDIIAILDLSKVCESRQNLRIINEMKARNNPADQSVIIVQRGSKEEKIFTNIAVSTPSALVFCTPYPVGTAVGFAYIDLFSAPFITPS